MLRGRIPTFNSTSLIINPYSNTSRLFVNPTWALQAERLELTLCQKTIIHERQQYGNDNFKEIVVGTSHRILKQRLQNAQQTIGAR